MNDKRLPAGAKRKMKALTLRPHWAWLVVNGYKNIENRSWKTKIRGRIWIHSGTKSVTKSENEEFSGICKKHGIKRIPNREDFKLGGIVGSVEIVDCVVQSRSPWFFGPYGFVLKDARKIHFRPLKGKLGFFEVREEN